ncbi:SDR family oxidoreductase [Tianweitania sp. BSSL-BM11]|uniref:SDR family oxidoreductase n=1 Tax=Tianweitania aestuarii TaxID=2814886 RepID=A0ABS5S1G6_9HYPH|nr:SDR family oxidoreductase [Tianweitania aestuarii]MBS9722371.1 SDR family oxidoreductase [Tianweitania aestuarii]
MTRHKLLGSVVVITGASSGIGQATAEAFARRGVRLVLAARGKPALEAVAQTCRAFGSEVLVVPTDVTDSAAVKTLAEKALEFGGRIDVWVSNVGVGAVGAFHETPIEAHEQVLRSSLIGHINDAHAVLPIFLRQDRGTFVNMISVGAFAAVPFAATYSASKFGLRGFSEALRGELVDHPDIHICDIYPTFVDTPGIHNAGNFTGKVLTAPPPVIDARRVAKAVLSAAENPRSTILIGEGSSLIRLGTTLFPRYITRFMGIFMRSYLDQAEPIAKSNGNLFTPPTQVQGIDGGLRSPEQRALATVIAVGAVGGLAVLGLGAMALRSRLKPKRKPVGRKRRLR